MISVIIPVYNSALYLKDTLESVLHQTYTDLELLVIDDGSTDNSREEIQKFLEKDKRVKYFYKENGGVSSARNRGILQASGEYISFLDSDDLWEPVFLERMYRRITEEQKRLCYCGYIEKQGDREFRYPHRFGTEDALMGKLGSDSFRVSTDCWLIHREFLLSQGILFTEGCHYLEDLEFFVKILYKAGEKQVTFVPEYLTYYVLRSHSLTYQQELVPSLSVMTRILAVQKRIYTWLKTQTGEENKYSEAMQRGIKKKYIIFLWNRLLLGNYQDFKKLLRAYYADRPLYFFHQPLHEKKYRIWSFCLFCVPARYFCAVFLRPYKYIRRKMKIHNIVKSTLCESGTEK